MKPYISLQLLTLLPLLVATLLSAAETPSEPPESDSIATVEQSDKGFEVRINGEFFTRYNHQGFSGPILWPVEAPGKIRMLRNWPMIKDTTGEEKDHPHHKGIFIGHQKVNNIDFWLEHPERTGKIEHLRLIETRSGQGRALLKTLNAWKTPKGQTIGADTRTLSFWGNDVARFIDLEVTLHATHEDLVFGEMKDGFFGIRTHPDLRLSAKPGKGVKQVFGEAVNSEGVSGKKIWGTRADWVHYFGTVEGNPAGVAFFSHPSNPTQDNKKSWWHARDYGLIAANPFAPLKMGGDGRRVVPQGESLTLRYRLVFYAETQNKIDVPELFSAYAKDPGHPTPSMPEYPGFPTKNPSLNPTRN